MKRTVERRFSLDGLIYTGLIFVLLGLVSAKSIDCLARRWAFCRFEGPASAHAATIENPQSLPDFVALAKRLKPVVVNISTIQHSGSGEASPAPLGEEDPFSDFWKRFYDAPLPRESQRQTSLGSGFIIDRDGTILTNNHVVDRAEKIIVKLSDEREFEGRVVGNDQKTDIAIVKIDAQGDWPVAGLGDSDLLEVGEWVMAIGNPFGLDNTVTHGIVSAKGRNIGAGPYDNFIQTDASINPGNSGGPLINLRGEVVGINTAIFSESEGNVGIGFATPINLVKELLPQLKTKGKVVRGYLGVTVQRVTPEIAEALALSKARGALVSDVKKEGPADRAGIRAGDLIVEFDGKEIMESNELPLLVARTPVGKPVRLRILRVKKELTLYVTMGELKGEEVVASIPQEGKLGLAVQAVTPQIAESLGLERGDGVVVASVKAGSPAEEAGLKPGDVILEIDRKPIHHVSDYRKAVAEAGQGKGMLILVRREEGTMFLVVKR